MKKKHTSTGNKTQINSLEKFVLYADIMGFRARVKSKDHASLKKEMEEFIFQIRKQSAHFSIGDHLNYAIFSDSIIISTDNATQDRFNLITQAGARLMHTALKLGVPLKGVISKGAFTHSKEDGLYVGRALVDAYELHEELKYYGIVVHYSAEGTAKKYVSEEKYSYHYMNSQVSLKSGKISHYHLCWNLISEILCCDDITAKAIGWLDKISEGVSGAPRIYIDNTRSILEADSQVYNKAKTEQEGQCE